MKDTQAPPFRSWNPGFEQEPFPGIGGEALSGPPALVNPEVIPAAAAAPATKSGFPFNISNLGDVKALVDRMGGIDGVLSTMGKVQKFMATMQQVAPMLKLFMGKKGSSGGSSNSGSSRRRSYRKPGSRSRRGGSSRPRSQRRPSSSKPGGTRRSSKRR